ncbi:MAG TPA: helix-turn-helix domain-containing protein [Thermomicrobiales bacterium]|nr:helix-turn-helix domain-containing protein [Thermomicrobiales bacterium]
MDQSRFDLLLHPVRMQIIQMFIAGRQLTAQELGERLTDVPPATLYRHLNTLVGGGVLTIAEERRGRGSAERVYALQRERVSIPAEDLLRASPADHMRYFTTFIAGVLGSFGRYLKRPKIDFVNDGAGYRQITLNLTRAELETLVDDLNARLYRELENEPSPGRQLYTITRVVVPEDHRTTE